MYLNRMGLFIANGPSLQDRTSTKWAEGSAQSRIAIDESANGPRHATRMTALLAP